MVSKMKVNDYIEQVQELVAQLGDVVDKLLVKVGEVTPGLSVQNRITTMSALDELAESVAPIKASLTKAWDGFRFIHVPEAMEEEGIESITVENVGRCSITTGLTASIAEVFRPEAYTWLSDHGHGGLIKETVNAQSLSAAVKEMIQTGEEVPEFIKVNPFVRASITNTNKKKNA